MPAMYTFLSHQLQQHLNLDIERMSEKCEGCGQNV